MKVKDEIINLCSHEISIEDASGKIVKIMPSAPECRVKLLPKDIHYHANVRVYRDVYDDVKNLPPPKKGVLYVVSAKVTNALNGARADVVSPGRQSRDKGGNVLYSIGLRRKY